MPLADTWCPAAVSSAALALGFSHQRDLFSGSLVELRDRDVGGTRRAIRTAHEAVRGVPTLPLTVMSVQPERL